MDHGVRRHQLAAELAAQIVVFVLRLKHPAQGDRGHPPGGVIDVSEGLPVPVVPGDIPWPTSKVSPRVLAAFNIIDGCEQQSLRLVALSGHLQKAYDLN
jgi:hypothetical protein